MTNESMEQELKVNGENVNSSSDAMQGNFLRFNVVSRMAAENMPLFLSSVND